MKWRLLTLDKSRLIILRPCCNSKMSGPQAGDPDVTGMQCTQPGLAKSWEACNWMQSFRLRNWATTAADSHTEATSWPRLAPRHPATNAKDISPAVQSVPQSNRSLQQQPDLPSPRVCSPSLHNRPEGLCGQRHVLCTYLQPIPANAPRVRAPLSVHPLSSDPPQGWCSV